MPRRGDYQKQRVKPFEYENIQEFLSHEVAKSLFRVDFYF